LPPERDFARRPATDANIVAETRERAAQATDPAERARLLAAADELERLSAEDRARQSSAAPKGGDEFHMADPSQTPPAAPPGGPSAPARPPMRSTRALTPAERTQLLQMAAEMGYPPERVQFHDGPTSVRNGVLRIGPDINPLPPEARPTGVANPANLAVGPRGVLGHEIIGHIEAFLMGQRRSERWHEEFQASTRAALHTPNLPPDQFRLLMADAAARLRHQTQPGTIFIETGRPGAPPETPTAPRPPEHFRPQDQLPSVMIDWNALGLPPPEGAAGPRPPAAAPGAPLTPSARAAPAAPAAPAPTAPPPATSPAAAATTATAQRAPAPPGTSGTGGTGGTHGFTEPAAPARPGAAAPRAATSGLGATVDRLRHGYAGTVAGGLWSAMPGVEQVHRVGRIGSAWFGEDRLRPPPSRRDAMGNAVGYSRTEQRVIGAGGAVGATLGAMAGGPLGAYVGQRAGEGVARRSADFVEGLTRGATEPIVERVNPNYPPPPEGGYDQVNALQERLARILEARARAEQVQEAADADAQHHQANAAPLAQFQQQTAQSMTATQAHQAATQRRQEANAQRQGREGDVSAALADAAQRRSGLSTLTVPLRAFQGFSSLGESMPDGIPLYPRALVGPKNKIRQLNRDATDFLNALDGVDATITEQQSATAPRQQEAAQHGTRLDAARAGAATAQGSLQGTQQQGEALAQRNQERSDDSNRMAGDAAAQGARLDGEAQQTQADMQTAAQRWQAWATMHRAARQAAIEQRRRALEERGYRVREVTGQR
jgi:hypothetical protein